MKPKILILRTQKGHKYANYIAKEINILGHFCDVIPITKLKNYLKKCSPDHTIIHARTAHPEYTYKVLKLAEKQGYKVVNSAETIKLTSNKYESNVFAEKNNIPCAETILVDNIDTIKEKIKQWGEVIVKPLTSQGNGIYCFKYDNVNQVKMPERKVVLQKFVKYSRLNRVIVIGQKAVDVFYDEPVDWKCSVCINPKIKHDKNPPKELLEFAENTAKKFKAEISFIDIFTTENGYVLNEINTACSLIIHERVSKNNISKQIAEYLLK